MEACTPLESLKGKGRLLSKGGRVRLLQKCPFISSIVLHVYLSHAQGCSSVDHLNTTKIFVGWCIYRKKYLQGSLASAFQGKKQRWIGYRQLFARKKQGNAFLSGFEDQIIVMKEVGRISSLPCTGLLTLMAFHCLKTLYHQHGLLLVQLSTQFMFFERQILVAMWHFERVLSISLYNLNNSIRIFSNNGGA